jgi:hypothetical protein
VHLLNYLYFIWIFPSVYLDHLVPLEAVNHGKEGNKGGHIFHKGGMSFIGIIGMNSRYEAEIQIPPNIMCTKFSSTHNWNMMSVHIFVVVVVS